MAEPITSLGVTTEPELEAGALLDVTLTLPSGSTVPGRHLVMFARSFPTQIDAGEHLPAALELLGWQELGITGWWWKRSDDVEGLTEEFSIPAGYETVEAIVELLENVYDDDGPEIEAATYPDGVPTIADPGWGGHVRWYGAVEVIEAGVITSTPAGYSHVGTSADEDAGFTLRADAKNGMAEEELPEPYTVDAGEAGDFFALRGAEDEPPPPPPPEPFPIPDPPPTSPATHGPTVRMPSSGLLIELFDNNPNNFGPSTRVSIVTDAHRVGWAQWSRFPPQAFFTLRKASVHNDRIVAGLSHIRIWYQDVGTSYGPVLVFNGRVGDASETRDDVVWRCHGYLAELALSRTGYRVMYQGKKIRAAVLREFNRNDAKGKFKEYGARRQDHGLLRHVALGTVQNPMLNNRPIKLESGFGVIDVPRLLFFFDLSEIGRANTNQNVTFEITRSTNPTFNFWRNRGTTRAGIGLRLPGNIRSFQFVRGVADVRNDLASIGTRKGQAREIKHAKAGGARGYEAFGRRQDTFSIRTLAGFRNLDEDAGRFSAQKMVVKRAVNEATRPTRELALDVPVDLLQPFDGWDIEDVMPVEIDDGRTQLNLDYRIVGVQGIMDGAGYRQRLYVVTEDT